jgi:hypothetical protein
MATRLPSPIKHLVSPLADAIRKEGEDNNILNLSLAALHDPLALVCLRITWAFGPGESVRPEGRTPGVEAIGFVPRTPIVRLLRLLSTPAEIEDMILPLAWHMGAEDIVRMSRGPSPLDKSGLPSMGTGIPNAWGRCSFESPGLGLLDCIGDDPGDDLMIRAAKEGYWHWYFIVAFGRDPFKIARWCKQDPTLNEHGGRDVSYPGLRRDGWYTAAKRFERPHVPHPCGVDALRMVYDFRGGICRANPKKGW